MALFSVTLSDPGGLTPNYTKPPNFSIFCIAFHIFVVGGDRDFKFGWQIDRSKS